MQNKYSYAIENTQPLSSGWLSSSVPWSIKNPTSYQAQTGWLTRVLPTSQLQSDVNILVILCGSRTINCATTLFPTSFVVRDVEGMARGRFFSYLLYLDSY
jgi:hypothetical protein